MTATAPLAELGQTIRSERKRLQVSTVDTALAARISRATLHRIERGEDNVAIGLYAEALRALGLELTVRPRTTPAGETRDSGPDMVRFEDCPELRKIAWYAPGINALPAKDALSLYERNWRHVDTAAMSESEKRTIRRLVTEYGNGVFLV